MPTIDPLLDDVVTRGATALHIAAGCAPCVRLGQELVPVDGAVFESHDVEELLLELLDGEQREELAEGGAVRFSHAHGSAARFSATIVRALGGLRATLRVLPRSARSLDELGCPASATELARRGAGIVIVTGGARAERAAVLVAMVRTAAEARPVHVVTVEDPIEVVLPPERGLVTQREIGLHAPSSEAGLRAALHDDAEVVMATDVDSAGAARAALALAAAGVIVFVGARHAAAAEALFRAGGGEERLATSILGVVSLRGGRGGDETIRVHAGPDAFSAAQARRA
jgi:twitching motility protein PilT